MAYRRFHLPVRSGSGYPPLGGLCRGCIMTMTYRCKSCGSNSTANLTCDYCGAGTKQRKVHKTNQSNQTGVVNDLKIVVSAFLASTAFFAACIITVGNAL